MTPEKENRVYENTFRRSKANHKDAIFTLKEQEERAASKGRQGEGEGEEDYGEGKRPGSGLVGSKKRRKERVFHPHVYPFGSPVSTVALFFSSVLLPTHPKLCREPSAFLVLCVLSPKDSAAVTTVKVCYLLTVVWG